MQTLLEAVRAKYKEWPTELDGLYFNCDKDGEVRQRGIAGTRLDFYPDRPVRYEDRRKVYMVDDQGEARVYKSDFNAK